MDTRRKFRRVRFLHPNRKLKPQTNGCPQIFVHKRLSTNCCPQDFVTNFCPQNFVHKRLSTNCCPQNFVHKLLSQTFVHKRLSTNCCPQKFVHKVLSLLSTNFCPQTSVHKLLSTKLCPQTSVHQIETAAVKRRRVPSPPVRMTCAGCFKGSLSVSLTRTRVAASNKSILVHAY